MTKEDYLQMQVMSYIRYQYPDLLAFHTPNGGNRNALEGAKFKRMGVLPGVPDILIPKPNKKYNGLCIELKIAPNKPTESQKNALKKFAQSYWQTEVCYDYETATKIIDNYLKN